jgi:hypothetical protein
MNSIFQLKPNDDVCTDEWDEDGWHNAMFPSLQIRERPRGHSPLPFDTFYLCTVIHTAAISSHLLSAAGVGKRTPVGRKRSSRKLNIKSDIINNKDFPVSHLVWTKCCTIINAHVNVVISMKTGVSFGIHSSCICYPYLGTIHTTEFQDSL